jgi:hypothetical protein
LLLLARTGKRAPLVAPTRMIKMEPILRWKWELAPPPPPQLESCRFWSIFLRRWEGEKRWFKGRTGAF